MTENHEDHDHLETSDAVRNMIANAGDGHFDKVDAEGVTYIRKEVSGFDSRALQAILENIVDMATKGLELFKSTDKDEKKLDIVGSVLYSISEMYRLNIETLKHWHNQLVTMPKLTAELNEELSGILGREIHIEELSDEDADKLVAEAVSGQLTGDLDKIQEIFDKKDE